MLTSVSREIEFDSAHRLLDSPESKCFEMHGHRYKLIAHVSGFINNKGEVIEFGLLKDILTDNIHDELDHQLINLVIAETNATVEKLLEWCWARIAAAVSVHGVLLTKLEIWETPACKAEKNLDIGYITGMLDGDGSISQSGNIEIQLRISNTNLQMLETLLSDIGAGSIQKGAQPHHKGYLKNPILIAGCVVKQCYALVVPRRAARVLCALCLPYLRIKTEQALCCIEYGPMETGQSKLPHSEWERRASILTRLSKANGHSRVWSADEMIIQQEKFRQNRRISSKKSYERRKNVL